MNKFDMDDKDLAMICIVLMVSIGATAQAFGADASIVRDGILALGALATGRATAPKG